MPLAFWDGPQSLCGVCFFLNKSTSYLSLCLSLNSFYNETSRTWASLSHETRCVSSVERLCVQAPIWATHFQLGFYPRPTGYQRASWNHLMSSSFHPHLSHFTGNIWLKKRKENRFLYPKFFRFHIDTIVRELVVNTLGIKGRQRWRPLQSKPCGDHHYPTTESQKPNLAAHSHIF